MEITIPFIATTWLRGRNGRRNMSAWMIIVVGVKPKSFSCVTKATKELSSWVTVLILAVA